MLPRRDLQADTYSPAEVLNYAKYIKENIASQCPDSSTTAECFGTHDDEKFQDDGLDQTWRLWLFQGELHGSHCGQEISELICQVCTQWGYFMPAPLEGPSILSKR